MQDIAPTADGNAKKLYLAKKGNVLPVTKSKIFSKSLPQDPHCSCEFFSFKRIYYILKFWVWSIRKKSNRKPRSDHIYWHEKKQLPCILSKSVFRPWCSQSETTCVKIRDVRLLTWTPLSRCWRKLLKPTG